MSFIHRIAHALGWYHGKVESFYIGDALYTGFKCGKCGEINHASGSDFRIRYEISLPEAPLPITEVL